jgi:hypothetical protein
MGFWPVHMLGLRTKNVIRIYTEYGHNTTKMDPIDAALATITIKSFGI